MQTEINQKQVYQVPFFIVYILSITLISISLLQLSHWVYHKMEMLSDIQTEVYQSNAKEIFINKDEVNKEIVRLRIEYSETDLFKPVPLLKDKAVYQNNLPYKIADN